MLDLENFNDLDMQPEDQERTCHWQLLSTKGPSPGAISHHSSVVYQGKMYLFGGNMRNNDGNEKLYCLNIGTLTWSIIKTTGGIYSRDEHTAELHDGKMYIFGGFEKGLRQNSVIIYDFETSTWTDPIECGAKGPVPRAGHSSCIY